jgi:hypothetical protein
MCQKRHLLDIIITYVDICFGEKGLSERFFLQ